MTSDAIKCFVAYKGDSTLTTSITLTNVTGIWDAIHSYEQRNPNVCITHYLNEENNWVSTDAMRIAMAQVDALLSKHMPTLFNH